MKNSAIKQPNSKMGIFWMFFKRLILVFYQMFQIIRERFFLVIPSGMPPPQPSPFLGEGMGGIEFSNNPELLQKQPSCPLFEEEIELVEKGTEDIEIPSLLDNQRISLCETLDRVLNTGVVIHGDITISVANIDLIYIGLRALLTSVETARQMQAKP